MPLSEDVPVRRKSTVRATATQKRQRDILDTAARAFSENGFRSSSLRDIATRAGISHAGLLHHYPDKNALLEAVLDDRFSLVGHRLGLESDEPEEFFRGLVALAEAHSVDPEEARLVTGLGSEATAPDHPAHGYFARWYEGLRVRMTAHLDALDARGLYIARGVPTSVGALHILSMRDGLHIEYFYARADIDLASVVRAQLGLYIDIDLS